MGNSKIALILLAAAAAVACTAQRHYSADAWHAPPPLPYPVNCSSLDRSQFAEIAPEDFARYAASLEASAALPLSAAQAAELAPTIQAPQLGSKPYLLRALFLNRHTGRFSVCEFATGVLVSHGSLGANWPPMTRTALVAYLTREPERVYVSVSMAR